MSSKKQRVLKGVNQKIMKKNSEVGTESTHPSQIRLS